MQLLQSVEVNRRKQRLIAVFLSLVFSSLILWRKKLWLHRLKRDDGRDSDRATLFKRTSLRFSGQNHPLQSTNLTLLRKNKSRPSKGGKLSAEMNSAVGFNKTNVTKQTFQTTGGKVGIEAQGGRSQLESSGKPRWQPEAPLKASNSRRPGTDESSRGLMVRPMDIPDHFLGAVDFAFDNKETTQSPPMDLSSSTTLSPATTPRPPTLSPATTPRPQTTPRPPTTPRPQTTTRPPTTPSPPTVLESFSQSSSLPLPPSSSPSFPPSLSPSSSPIGSALLPPNLEDPHELCPTGRLQGLRYFVKPFDNQFTETSYLVYSKQKPQQMNHYRARFDSKPVVMWMGSDGSRDSIAAVDLTTGKVISVFKLNINRSSRSDWESIARGPCTSEPDSKSCLYIGDVGNNGAATCMNQKCQNGRDSVLIFKLVEPDLSYVTDFAEESRANDGVTLQVMTIEVNYHHKDMPTNRANCESIFVDFTGDGKGGVPGDIYLVTKSQYRDLQRVVKVPASIHENLSSANNFASFSAIPVSKPHGDKMWTGADMNEDGSLIVLRSLRKVYFFPRTLSQTVGEAMEADPCDFVSETETNHMNENQFESVSIMNTDMAEASECDNKSSCTVAVTVNKLQFNS